nr:hypothetical protein [uncultured Desulfobulbus sp.]
MKPWIYFYEMVWELFSTAAPLGKTSWPTIPPVATSRIGRLEIARLPFGANIITHHDHAHGLQSVRNLSRHCKGADQVMATAAEARTRYQRAFMIHHDEAVIRLRQDFCGCGDPMLLIVVPDPKVSKETPVFSGAMQQLMAACAISLHNVFEYVCENGVNCILAGMCDLEISEGAQTSTEEFVGIGNKNRRWFR